MNFDADRFIIEIENRSAIWDSRIPQYSNKVIKGRAWEEICQLFVPSFTEMGSTEKNKAAVDMQRKWKSFRDSFRRELKNKKESKSGSGAETGRKEYVYFKQLLFLSPLCETKPSEEDVAEEEETTDSEKATTPHSQDTPKTKRKTGPVSEEQRLFQLIAKNLENKATAGNESSDDPDRHFLLSLLPHFKTIPDDLKLDAQMEFIDVVKRYKRPAPLSSRFVSPIFNQQFNSSQAVPSTSRISYSPRESASYKTSHSSYLQEPMQNCYNQQPRVLTKLQPMRIDVTEEEASQVPTPLSSESSVYDDFF